jgi:hypothetical protein
MLKRIIGSSGEGLERFGEFWCIGGVSYILFDCINGVQGRHQIYTVYRRRCYTISFYLIEQLLSIEK